MRELERIAREEQDREDRLTQMEEERYEKAQKEHKRKLMSIDREVKVAKRKTALLNEYVSDAQMGVARAAFELESIESEKPKMPARVAALRTLQQGVPYQPPTLPVMAAGGAAGGSVSRGAPASAGGSVSRGAAASGGGSVSRGAAASASAAAPAPPRNVSTLALVVCPILAGAQVMLAGIQNALN